MAAFVRRKPLKAIHCINYLPRFGRERLIS